MTLAAKLDEAIKAVCPIDGVSIGRKTDKATWRIDFKSEATAQQRLDAQVALNAFDVAASDAAEAAMAARAATDDSEAAAEKLDAQVQTFLNMTPAARNDWIDANINDVAGVLQQPAKLRLALKVLGAMAQHAARGKGLR